MSKTFTQNIEGYWRDINKGGLPSYSGVYFVYTATYNKNNDTVTLNRLIYIGTADNVNSRIAGHEKDANWRRYLEA